LSNRFYNRFDNRLDLRPVVSCKRGITTQVTSRGLLLEWVCISSKRLLIVSWSTCICRSIFVSSKVMLHFSKLSMMEATMFRHSWSTCVSNVAKLHCYRTRAATSSPVSSTNVTSRTCFLPSDNRHIIRHHCVVLRLIFYRRQGGYIFIVVCLFVCLSICLSVSNFVKKHFRTDLHEIFEEGWQWAIEQTIKFWW